MSYEKKAPLVRVDKSLDDYLRKLSKQTKLPKVQVSRMLAQELNGKEVIEKKRWKFDFKFKI